MLTADQIKRRAEIIEDMRLRVQVALWKGVEAASPELLAADDGTPYAEMVAGSLGQSQLERIVIEAASVACEHLKFWL